MPNNKIAQPFVKWVGGKRQLIEKITEKLPKKFNDYYEPFIGGGAVMFNINASKKIYINDINTQLINTYNQIKKNPTNLMNTINKFNSEIMDENNYIKIREQYNNKIINKEYDTESAALFMLLNKYCFNGLYRVNKKGLFNVPWNKKEHVNIYEEENINLINEKLKKVEISSGDFANILKTAKKGDFIFFDSPYAPLNDTSFDSYTKNGFTKEEHERLAEEFRRLDGLGCYVMLTNHNTSFIRELYADYNIEEVNVKRMVNSDASNRVGKEVIITNY